MIPHLHYDLFQSRQKGASIYKFTFNFEVNWTNHWRKAVGSGHYLRSVTGLSVFTSRLKVEKVNNGFDEFFGIPLPFALSLSL